MKIKLCCLCMLLLLFTSCYWPWASRELVLNWDTEKCRVYIDGKEVTGGYYYQLYSDDDYLVEIDVQSKEENGWFNPRLSQSFDAFPHGGSDNAENFPAVIEVRPAKNKVIFYFESPNYEGLKKSGDTVYTKVAYPYLEPVSYRYFSYNKLSGLRQEITEASYSTYQDYFTAIDHSDLSHKMEGNFRTVSKGDRKITIPIDVTTVTPYNPSWGDAVLYVDELRNTDDNTVLILIQEDLNRKRLFVWDLDTDDVNEVPMTYENKPGYEFNDTCKDISQKGNYIYYSYITTDSPDASTSNWQIDTEFSECIRYDLTTKQWTRLLYNSCRLSGDNTNRYWYFEKDYYYSHYSLFGSDSTELKLYSYDNNLLFTESLVDLEAFYGYDMGSNEMFYATSEISFMLQKPGESGLNMFPFSAIK